MTLIYLVPLIGKEAHSIWSKNTLIPSPTASILPEGITTPLPATTTTTQAMTTTDGEVDITLKKQVGCFTTEWLPQLQTS